MEPSLALDNPFDLTPPPDYGCPGTAGDGSLPPYQGPGYSIYGRTLFVEASGHYGK
ncbi:MAG TPA: hypothetical protein VGF89_04150 [Steroidobacteraceae bacterium]|jgi:hypothetical protein